MMATDFEFLDENTEIQDSTQSKQNELVYYKRFDHSIPFLILLGFSIIFLIHWLIPDEVWFYIQALRSDEETMPDNFQEQIFWQNIMLAGALALLYITSVAYAYYGHLKVRRGLEKGQIEIKLTPKWLYFLPKEEGPRRLKWHRIHSVTRSDNFARDKSLKIAFEESRSYGGGDQVYTANLKRVIGDPDEIADSIISYWQAREARP